MKKIKTIALAFTLLIAGSATSIAQTKTHEHKAVHGGTVKEASGYHVEMVKNETNLSFFLMDGKNKILTNKEISGTATFEFFNKMKATVPLTKNKKSVFSVSIPKANNFAYCTVSFLIKDKNIIATFKNDAVSQADINHGHQH